MTVPDFLQRLRARTLARAAFLTDPSASTELEGLAREFGLPLVAPDDDQYDFLLAWNDGGLELRDRRDPRLNPLRLDFAAEDARPYAPALSRRQPFARAFGKTRFIVDATAGLAQDAMRLARMGFSVVAIERSPVTAALVQDALRRYGAKVPLRFIRGDAREVLAALAPKPEAVYLDPMFPDKRRESAAVRKELKWLRELVGDDDDALELFEAAKRAATHRVIVKRPDHAPPLVPNPAASIAGKLVRYDIYSTRI
jgi:16S rRNA (guanine1516-N2)-methyltransferase